MRGQSKALEYGHALPVGGVARRLRWLETTNKTREVGDEVREEMGTRLCKVL